MWSSTRRTEDVRLDMDAISQTDAAGASARTAREKAELKTLVEKLDGWTEVEVADASALGSEGEEATKLRATREPLLTKFGDDATMVTCHLLILQLLREHDYRLHHRSFWRLPVFGAYRTSMVALVHAYWECFIFLALAIGLACASGNLAGGALYSAMVAAISTFYIANRTCVVNADKDCRPKIELHRRKSRSIESVLNEHSTNLHVNNESDSEERFENAKEHHWKRYCCGEKSRLLEQKLCGIVIL